MQENTKNQVIKVAKDLSFLQNIQPIVIDRFTVKYILDEGKGQMIKNIYLPIDIFVSYLKYSYSGQLLYKSQPIKTSNQNDQSKPIQSQKYSRSQITKLKPSIMDMKLNEKAWLNISDQELPFHLLKLLNEQSQIKTEEQQLQPKETTMVRTGHHYQIYLQRIQYRNMQDFESKKKVIQQTRQKAKQFYSKANYNEAIIKYKYISNITQNLSRNKYKPQEMQYITQSNLRTKLNFVVCYFKLCQDDQNEDEYKVFAQNALKTLIQNKYNESKVYYYNAKWLFKQRFMQDALDYAMKAKKLQEKDSNIRQLIEEIKQAISNKGKIKIEVNQYE